MALCERSFKFLEYARHAHQGKVFGDYSNPHVSSVSRSSVRRHGYRHWRQLSHLQVKFFACLADICQCDFWRVRSRWERDVRASFLSATGLLSDCQVWEAAQYSITTTSCQYLIPNKGGI
jgi:hypothetical protein